MKADNTTHYLKIAGRILTILGFLAIPVSIFSWSALNFIVDSDWWHDHVHWHFDSIRVFPFFHDSPLDFFYIFPFAYFLGAILFIISGIGLIQEKEWATRLVWIPAVLLLFKFPIGTALGIWIIYLLQKRKEFLAKA